MNCIDYHLINAPHPKKINCQNFSTFALDFAFSLYDVKQPHLL